jgi:hypothetical protein
MTHTVHFRSSKLYVGAVALLTCAVVPAILAAASKGKNVATHWVATWAASPSLASPDDQMRRRKLEFDNQTVRLIAHIRWGESSFEFVCRTTMAPKPWTSAKSTLRCAAPAPRFCLGPTGRSLSAEVRLSGFRLEEWC